MKSEKKVKDEIKINKKILEMYNQTFEKYKRKKQGGQKKEKKRVKTKREEIRIRDVSIVSAIKEKARYGGVKGFIAHLLYLQDMVEKWKVNI